jgi:tripartite-type tricarboxylate transporter receptor subunit TctC
MNKRRFLLSSLALTTHSCLPRVALAQAGFPSQPLRIIVATPAGGASDTAARLLAQSLSKNLDQPVLVENKPGGNGVPAVQAVQSAAPDGHTLLWAQASMASLPLLMKAAPIKSISEFTPVSTVVNLVYGLLVNPRVPVTTVSQLSAHLRDHPDRLNYGTGVLSEYLLTVHYLHAIGAKAVRVPYKGGAQLMPDLIGGELQFNFGPLAPALPHVHSGKLRLLATLPERSDAVPGVPSLAEAGIRVDALPTWNGLVAPPGTALDVANRIAQEVNRALTDPTLRAALETQGFRVAGSTPRQMGEAIEVAMATWRQFVRDYDVPQE